MHNKSVLRNSFFLIFTFMIVEAVFGFVSNSLALISDAFHMLSDAAALFLSLVAFKIAEKRANLRKTFGYKRVEIIAAFINAIALIALAVFVIAEAIVRLFNEPQIEAKTMLFVSILGLVVNLVVAIYMHKSSDIKENLNIKGAYLHVLGDTLGSVGAIIAALVIMKFGLTQADSIASIFVSILIIKSGFGLLKDSFNILIEAVPVDLNTDEILAIIKGVDGVRQVHDLHIWTISAGSNALIAHVVVDDVLSVGEISKMIKRIEHELSHVGIGHVTLQFESSSHGHKDELICELKSKEEHGHFGHKH
ncbi:cation diffusion facilitator family transporter [Campylobacter concisus]|uniref:cation diffusion facilitator family transporter n=1 Tax=Campylobacter concisus TaxID=199 RepID=UPI000CD7FE55|nr:cation diffusion facilitator family transporter [Campylobacter concisus]